MTKFYPILKLPLSHLYASVQPLKRYLRTVDTPARPLPYDGVYTIRREDTMLTYLKHVGSVALVLFYLVRLVTSIPANQVRNAKG